MTRTFSIADAIIAFNEEGISAVYVEDFDYNAKPAEFVALPMPVAIEFGRQVRTFADMQSASAYLAEVGAIFGQTLLLHINDCGTHIQVGLIGEWPARK